MKFKILVLVMLGMAVAIAMMGCEAENPGEATPNKPPNTYISEASPGNMTRISFYGTDTDGFVETYDYMWEGDDDWTSTSDNSVEFADVFESETDLKTFMVRSIDNNGMMDPEPAEITLSPSNVLPETQITGGPEFGKASGVDMTFMFSGEDLDPGGEVVSFEYTMDDLDNWRETPVEHPYADYRGVGTGSHVFYVRAVDNLGGKDPSPAQVAFIVETGKYAPTLVNLSPLGDGGGWFAGVDLTFSWNSIVAEYYGTLAEHPYTYALNDPTGYNTSATDALASGWIADESFTVSPPAGSHTFYLKVRDTAGGVDTMRIRFSAATPSFDQGILVVNGVSPVYGTEITDRLDASAYWGTFEVAFWDLFGDMRTPSMTLPATVHTYEGGGAAVPPDIFAKYSTVVWLGNNYQGDLVYWNLSPILPYLTAGGNVIIASRLIHSFLGAYANPGAPLTAYFGIYPNWAEETILEFVPVFPGLEPMTPFTRGMSLTDGYSAGYGGFLNSADDNTVTNWDGVSSYTSSDLKTTLLWTHRSSDYDASYPFGYVRGLGFWAHPNFDFSSQSAVEFPTPGTDETKGNFILLVGRHYGYDIANTISNFDYMLKQMCGEQ